MLEGVLHSDAKLFPFIQMAKKEGSTRIYQYRYDNEDFANYILLFYTRYGRLAFKGLLHCFSTCIEITGNNWYCLT